MIIHPHSAGSVPRRVLNRRAVVICAVVLVSTTLSLQTLHSRQVAATTQFLKERADAAVSDGHPQDAIRALEMYLAFNPRDTNARHTLSETLSESAFDNTTLLTAYAMNEDLLLDDIDNHELRLRQSRLAVTLSRLSDADSHLSVLQRAIPNNAEVWQLSGIVADRMGNHTQAETYLERALSLDGTNAQACARLVEILDRRDGTTEQAANVLDSLVKANESADAQRVKARWLLKHNRLSEAVETLWEGLQQEPDNVPLNGMLLSALYSNNAGDLADVSEQRQKLIRQLENALQYHPSSLQLRLFTAHAQWNSQNRTVALETLRTGISFDPQEWQLQEILIDHLVSLERTQEAEAALARLPRTVINHAKWHFLQGRVQMSRGEWSPAISSFEQAWGFATADARVRDRARMSQAVCRRKLGLKDGTIDSYRAMLQADPASQNGRLGMAAAWLESGQTELAIAEYRQLLNVDGVPELLTSLLIREQLKQPESRRDWQEIESLLSVDSTVITDATQKQLLQIDLTFAQGQPRSAIRMLDEAADRQPSNPVMLSAHRRILRDDADLLRKRMQETILLQPDNLAAHVVLTRLITHRAGPDAAIEWLDSMTTNAHSSPLTDEERLHLVARVAEQSALDMQDVSDTETATLLLNESRNTWLDLAAKHPRVWPQAVRMIARHWDGVESIAVLQRMPASAGMSIRAESWLAALRNCKDKNQLRRPVEDALRHMIESEPSDLSLRQAYAQLLTQFAGYDGALSVVREILATEPHNATALSHCAWILTVTEGSQQEAMQLSERATRNAPGNTQIRTTRGLVLARSSNPQDALPVFRSIPVTSRSPQSYAYEALACLNCGDVTSAKSIAQLASERFMTARWCPADQDILQRVLEHGFSNDSSRHASVE